MTRFPRGTRTTVFPGRVPPKQIDSDPDDARGKERDEQHGISTTNVAPKAKNSGQYRRGRKQGDREHEEGQRPDTPPSAKLKPEEPKEDGHDERVKDENNGGPDNGPRREHRWRGVQLPVASLLCVGVAETSRSDTDLVTAG
ncbi:MAG: hypothetical protein ACI9PP_001141 [Halobacteriales archaeon]